jgi:pyruvate kinase
MPTRAEVTDIAHAATTRCDSTMLSGETAAGKHPLESVRAMALILQETEAHQLPSHDRDMKCALGEHSALAYSAVSMALSIAADAIVVLTRSGKTARAVSQLRANLPIIALTDDAKIQRSMQMLHGVHPLVTDFDDDPEVTVEHALEKVKKAGLLGKDQKIVLISDVQVRTERVHGVQIRTIK